MPGRRAPREPRVAERLPWPAGPRPSLPAPPRLQVSSPGCPSHRSRAGRTPPTCWLASRAPARAGAPVPSRHLPRPPWPRPARWLCVWVPGAPSPAAARGQPPAPDPRPPRHRAAPPRRMPRRPRRPHGGPLAGARTPGSRWQRAAPLTTSETFPPGLSAAPPGSRRQSSHHRVLRRGFLAAEKQRNALQRRFFLCREPTHSGTRLVPASKSEQDPAGLTAVPLEPGRNSPGPLSSK